MATSKSARTPKRKTRKRTNVTGTSKAAAQQRYRIFAEAYIANGGNKTDAAKTAGYSEKTAHTIGSRLFHRVEVQALIGARQNFLAEKYALTAEDVIQSLARAVRFDPRKLYNEDGSFKAVCDLDDDTADALAGFEVNMQRAGDKELDTGVKKYRWLDKNTAREQALKHLGLYEKDNRQKTDPLTALIERISGSALKPVK